jgi:hypothetical protein
MPSAATARAMLDIACWSASVGRQVLKGLSAQKSLSSSRKGAIQDPKSQARSIAGVRSCTRRIPAHANIPRHHLNRQSLSRKARYRWRLDSRSTAAWAALLVMRAPRQERGTDVKVQLGSRVSLPLDAWRSAEQRASRPDATQYPRADSRIDPSYQHTTSRRQTAPRSLRAPPPLAPPPLSAHLALPRPSSQEPSAWH